MSWRTQIENQLQKQSLLHSNDSSLERYHELDFASVALSLIQGEQGPGIVFIKRQINPDDPWSGHMALPGGRTEFGEDPHLTAKRECLEETGLVLEGHSYIMPSVQAKARGSYQGFNIHPCLFLQNKKWETLSSTLRPCPNEVQSIHFISLSLLLDPSSQAFIDWRLTSQTYRLPCLHIGENKIWGLTYWILEVFFKSLQGVEIEQSGDPRSLIINLDHWKEHPIL